MYGLNNTKILYGTVFKDTAQLESAVRVDVIEH